VLVGHHFSCILIIGLLTAISPMSDAKVFLLTIAIVGVLMLYLYWQNRTPSARWMPEDARRQLHRERRVPPRVKCAIPVSLEASRRSLTGLTRDIAIGGVLLTPSAPLSVGEPVHVSFELPGGPRIDIPGAVCRRQGKHVAIKFDFVTQQRALIQQWVDQQQHQI